jgi:hypothetical protein
MVDTPLRISFKKAAAADYPDLPLDNLMSDPDYMKHSSGVIHAALKEGFDVLQLPNGDIVTTGTKVIVTTYRWDDKRKKLSKSSSTYESATASGA